MANIPQFDKSKFSIGPFVKKVHKPWGYEIIFTQSDLPYTGKIIHVDGGKRLSMQVHDIKQETQMLISGACNLILENAQGELETISMEKGKGYTVAVGQRHRIHSVTDCDVFEVSTPEIGITYRLEDDYKRPDETEKMREEERK